MTDEQPSPYHESHWIEGVNELGEVLEGISIALDRPERFTSPHLVAMAAEIESVAKRYGVYEPID